LTSLDRVTCTDDTFAVVRVVYTPLSRLTTAESATHTTVFNSNGVTALVGGRNAYESAERRPGCPVAGSSSRDFLNRL